MEENLLDAFRKRRAEGRRCSGLWIKLTARKIFKEQYNDDTFSASNGWFTRFCARNHLLLRRKTNSKNKSAGAKVGEIANYHRLIRFLLQLEGANGSYPNWGRFTPF